MPDPSVKPRPSREARREELIESAFALFIERGFSATRLEDVAVRAGVAKGTVVVHFPTKEALFIAVVTHYVEPTVVRAETLLMETGTARERIIVLARFIHEAMRDPHVGGVPKLIISETGNFPELARSFHEQVCLRSRAAQAELIRQGIAAGEFRAVDPDIAARLLLEPMIMQAIWTHSLGRYESCPMSPDAYLDHHLDIFLRGLAAET